MKVLVLMGSDKDADRMAPASEMLERFGIDHDVIVASAHRTPERVAEIARWARGSGVAAIICGAGKAAHLAGAVAAHTTLPVIGVPISSGGLGGLDALLSTVQMPTGMPVATVAVDSAANAALLAISIMGVTDDDLAEALMEYREEWT
ncbi:5-(carboxyamino)imidazole ribonucleotide mutase [bacterium]|nr:5-(carboxyamino)imidazole ribonucleotide mutase [bacterium]